MGGSERIFRSAPPLMGEMLLKCPACESTLKETEVNFSGRRFGCPTCGEELYVPRSYSARFVVGALFISALLCLALGLRGIALYLATIALWFPILLLELILLLRVLPPPKIKMSHPRTRDVAPRDPANRNC